MPYIDYSRVPLDDMNIADRPETVRFTKLDYDGTTTFGLGVFVVEDATTKKARVATAADRYVFLNWSPSDMTSVSDFVINKFDQSGMSPTIYFDAGGLTGLIGAGTIVQLKLSKFDIGGLGVTPVVGYYIQVGVGAAPAAVNAPAGGTFSFGNVLRVDGNVVTCIFNSAGIVH